MFPALNDGATAFLTAFQCSSVCPVSRFVPPRNCTEDDPNLNTPHNVLRVNSRWFCSNAG